ncbi:MAG: hypothetical protein KatS3mg111_0396 [Pirellulaceae bacterium]|nr:MAG: hypothetical protein KatS3mg111_0396 [Pirellulaceae bacterium]
MSPRVSCTLPVSQWLADDLRGTLPGGRPYQLRASSAYAGTKFSRMKEAAVRIVGEVKPRESVFVVREGTAPEVRGGEQP